LGISEIITLLLVGTFIINAVLDYKANRFDSIPGELVVAFLLSIGVIFGYLPVGIKIPFIYTAVIIAVLACFLTSRFHLKRKNKFEYWFYFVLAIIFSFILILGALGIIPNK